VTVKRVALIFLIGRCPPTISVAKARSAILESAPPVEKARGGNLEGDRGARSLKRSHRRSRTGAFRYMVSGTPAGMGAWTTKDHA
jgi:hypothetical protein